LVLQKISEQMVGRFGIVPPYELTFRGMIPSHPTN